jgi:hypothetical protein
MKATMTVTFAVDVPDGTDLAGLYLGIPTDQVEVLSLAGDRPVEGAAVEGYETVSVESDEGAEDVQECGRCGCLLDGHGLCTDATCPFSDHKQECPAGWGGHPDHHGGPCSCGGRPAEWAVVHVPTGETVRGGFASEEAAWAWLKVGADPRTVGWGPEPKDITWYAVEKVEED